MKIDKTRFKTRITQWSIWILNKRYTCQCGEGGAWDGWGSIKIKWCLHKFKPLYTRIMPWSIWTLNEGVRPSWGRGRVRSRQHNIVTEGNVIVSIVLAYKLSIISMEK